MTSNNLANTKNAATSQPAVQKSERIKIEMISHSNNFRSGIFTFYLIIICLSIIEVTFAHNQIPKPNWHLETADTHLAIALKNNHLIVYELKNPGNGWNWIKIPSEMPFPEKVQVGTTSYKPDWIFKDAIVGKNKGTKITLTFLSTTPNLVLESVWEAKPGAGPIENQVTVRNNSGEIVSFRAVDVLSSNINLTADSTITLWRFNKGRYLGTKSKKDKPIVNCDQIEKNDTIIYYLSNDANGSSPEGINSHLPFQMFDIGSKHGLYVGYEWSFGVFKNQTGANQLQINYKSYLWDTTSVNIENGKLFKVPAVFFGTYMGNTDDGSNKMKQWFWNYKITPTIKNNPQEPLIEYCIPGNESQLTEYYKKYPVAEWGAELGKIDIDWLEGSGSDWTKGNFKRYPFWKPDSLKWPNGMTAGDIVHRNNQKLSLYMNFTFEWNDIATGDGRENEKSALLTRYDNWHYDYWRSDMVLEAKFNYLSHEGLLDILDYLITNRPGFRYEHCGNGGLLKDFTTLQRISVFTNEDSGGPEYHRESFYSCSYMINPVQIKTDIGMNLGPHGEVPNNAGYSPNGGVINDSPEWVSYTLRTGFMGANMATNWCFYTPNQIEGVKRHWPLYKSRQRPILRGIKPGDRAADVYHILPIPDGVNWDGIEYFNRSLNKGSILLFKASETVAGSKIIKLRGLNKKETYTLTFEDRKEQSRKIRGEELMEKGIEVKGMNGKYASEIVWIN